MGRGKQRHHSRRQRTDKQGQTKGAKGHQAEQAHFPGGFFGATEQVQIIEAFIATLGSPVATTPMQSIPRRSLGGDNSEDDDEEAATPEKITAGPRRFYIGDCSEKQGSDIDDTKGGEQSYLDFDDAEGDDAKGGEQSYFDFAKIEGEQPTESMGHQLNDASGDAKGGKQSYFDFVKTEGEQPTAYMEQQVSHIGDAKGEQLYVDDAEGEHTEKGQNSITDAHRDPATFDDDTYWELVVQVGRQMHLDAETYEMLRQSFLRCHPYAKLERDGILNSAPV